MLLAAHLFRCPFLHFIPYFRFVTLASPHIFSITAHFALWLTLFAQSYFPNTCFSFKYLIHSPYHFIYFVWFLREFMFQITKSRPPISVPSHNLRVINNISISYADLPRILSSLIHSSSDFLFCLTSYNFGEKLRPQFW